jgi:hypothetical protein
MSVSGKESVFGAEGSGEGLIAKKLSRALLNPCCACSKRLGFLEGFPEKRGVEVQAKRIPEILMVKNSLKYSDFYPVFSPEMEGMSTLKG